MGLGIRLLGALDMEADGEPVAMPAGHRLHALVGWLALHPGTHPRARLAGLLWPEAPPACARASLRSALWAVRRALGPRGGPALTASRDAVGFRAGAVTVDVAEFGRLAGCGRLAEAVGLCRGELLDGLDDDWACEARDHHSERLAGVLGQLAREAAAAGRPGTALTRARERAQARPLDEPAARDLMRRLADRDDTPGALLAYQRLRQRLLADLGVSPAAPTRRLAELLRARADADGDEPPEHAPPAGPDAGAATRRGPAPPATPARPLAGRRAELATLTAAWGTARTGTGQVVVLTGEGGVGKSCLAAALAARAHQQGAVSVSCAAGLSHPFGLWAETLAGILALTGSPPASARWPADLAALLPAFGPPPPAGPRALWRGRLFEAVATLLEWASGEHGLVLVLDDLHLADGASLDLLGYVARRAGGLRVLLLLGRRCAPPRPGLDRMLAALRARGVIAAELALAGLPDADIRALANRTARLARGDASRVVKLAAGNPRLALAAARSLGHHRPGGPRGTAGERGPAGDGLGQAVESAVRGLRPPARRFLELAALARRDFRRSELAALPLADPAMAATEALGCGLLRQSGARVGYRDPLLREVVREQIPVLLRDRMQVLLADALGPS